MQFKFTLRPASVSIVTKIVTNSVFGYLNIKLSITHMYHMAQKYPTGQNEFPDNDRDAFIKISEFIAEGVFNNP